MSSDNNIRKYKKPLKFNMGIFIFGMIFLYFLCFGLFRFIKNGHVSSYVVNSGSLSDNTTFTAFAIRNESVVKADKSGELQLYARESSKVACGDTVYTLDESGELKALMANLSAEQSQLSEADFKNLQGMMSNFQLSYNSSSFSKVYDLKTSLEADVLDSLSVAAINNSGVDPSKFEINKATEPGIVIYSYDGYEDVTLESFTKEMIDNRKLKKNSTRNVKNINGGDIVYKLVTDENWHLVMEIDDVFESKIKNEKSVEIRFIDDSQFAWVNFEIIERGGSKYLVLNLPNSAIRYATDRFVKIEIQTSSKTGLKVPKSAIVNKEFYTIPKTFLTQGGSTGGDGFLMDAGSIQAEFVNARIIYSDDKNYYIDKATFDSGTKLIKTKSNETFIVGPTATLSGVYNINKGYAVFETVTVLDENNEYAIVSSNSMYGVKKYDYIVLDGNSVKEDEIVH